MDTISDNFFAMQQKIRRLVVPNTMLNIILEDTLKGLLGCWVNIVDDVSLKCDNIFERFDGQMSSLSNMIKDVRIMGNVYDIADNEKVSISEYNDATDTFLSTLHKIRAMPESNLRGLMDKAFEAYIRFLHGESFRQEIEAWEKATGLIFREHYADGLKLLTPATPEGVTLNGDEDGETIKQMYEEYNKAIEKWNLNRPLSLMEEFNLFVHSYYNCKYEEKTPATVLISRMVNSKEETFDKYFELLDKFIKQKAKLFC